MNDPFMNERIWMYEVELYVDVQTGFHQTCEEHILSVKNIFYVIDCVIKEAHLLLI